MMGLIFASMFRATDHNKSSNECANSHKSGLGDGRSHSIPLNREKDHSSRREWPIQIGGENLDCDES